MKSSVVAALARWPLSLASDLRNSARTLRRQPVLVTAAVATLALGIGANVAIYLVAQAALFETSGFSHADRIVALENAGGTYFGARDSLSAPTLVDWQRQTAVFKEVASYARGAGNLQSTAAAEHVSVGLVTPRFFSVLGIAPAAGRDFLAGEELVAHADVALLSDELWRRDFGASRGVLGRTIQLSSKTYTIVGVMPRDFRFPGETDIWIPLTVPLDPSQIKLMRTAVIETVIARLGDQVGAQRAQFAVDRVNQSAERPHVTVDGAVRVRVTPFLSFLSRGRGTGLALLAGMGALLLLIASANVSNLLLSRASARLDELRLRFAIGGSSFRIAQQMMTEPLILSLAGGAAGVALAVWCSRAMVAMRIAPDGDFGAILLNSRAYELTAVVSVAVGALSGFLAFATLRKQARGTPGSSRAGESRAGSAARKTILAIQVALSFVLLVGTGLIIRSLEAVMNEDSDLPVAALTAEIALPPARYATQLQQATFASDFLQRVRAVPGVRNAGLVSGLPLTGDNKVLFPVSIPSSRDASGQNTSMNAEVEGVSPGYFEAMGLAVLQGRDISETDRLGAPPVAVISSGMATKYWPNSSAIGALISTPFDSVPSTIVGVVRAIRSYSLTRVPVPQVYYAIAQMPSSDIGLVVSGDDATRIAGAIRSSARSIDATTAVYRIRTYGAIRSDSVAPQRNRALILAALGALAIALAVIGVYGAAAYIVEQRTPEIGIRRALGAPDGIVIRGIIIDMMGPVIAGMIAGGAIAAATSRLISSILYGVSPEDPVTFAMAGAGLVLVALVAALLPASRAARIDPLEVMRVR